MHTFPSLSLALSVSGTPHLRPLRDLHPRAVSSFSARYDNSVVGWNLHAETDTPVFILEGHGSPVIGVTGMLTGDRAVSLDTDGLLILWDTTVREVSCPASRFPQALFTHLQQHALHVITRRRTYHLPVLMWM